MLAFRSLVHYILVMATKRKADRFATTLAIRFKISTVTTLKKEAKKKGLRLSDYVRGIVDRRDAGDFQM